MQSCFNKMGERGGEVESMDSFFFCFSLFLYVLYLFFILFIIMYISCLHSNFSIVHRISIALLMIIIWQFSIKLFDYFPCSQYNLSFFYIPLHKSFSLKKFIIAVLASFAFGLRMTDAGNSLSIVRSSSLRTRLNGT